MTRNQRIGLLVAAAAVIVVAIVIAASGGSDDGTEATKAAKTTKTTRNATEQPHETLQQGADSEHIRIKGGKVVGGPPDIKVQKGDHVRIVVSSDAHDDIHLHGYDIERPVELGQPAQFNFIADIEGIFEIESHVAEDEGREPLVAKLTVEPN
jgi:FtsP/CotA-like multicopper oxidase with cupredoxin domain